MYWWIGGICAAAWIGMFFGGLLSMRAMRHSARTGDPLPVFGEWMRVVPVWSLERDVMWKANIRMAKAFCEIIHAMRECEKVSTRGDLLMIVENPATADEHAIESMAEACLAVFNVIDNNNLARVGMNHAEE